MSFRGQLPPDKLLSRERLGDRCACEAIVLLPAGDFFFGPEQFAVLLLRSTRRSEEEVTLPTGGLWDNGGETLTCSLDRCLFDARRNEEGFKIKRSHPVHPMFCLHILWFFLWSVHCASPSHAHILCFNCDTKRCGAQIWTQILFICIEETKKS